MLLLLTVLPLLLFANCGSSSSLPNSLYLSLARCLILSLSLVTCVSFATDDDVVVVVFNSYFVVASIKE